MFRRLIVWLVEKKQDALWRAQLIRIYPTRRSFEAAAAEGLAKQSSITAEITSRIYQDGYRDGRALGYVEGFESCRGIVKQVFREEPERSLINSRLEWTN